jgi:hypothetical protein
MKGLAFSAFAIDC